MNTKVMISLPDQLFANMKALIPARQRSHIIADLLQKELATREEMLYQKALQLEQCNKLTKEAKNWDQQFVGDGLEDI